MPASTPSEIEIGPGGALGTGVTCGAGAGLEFENGDGLWPLPFMSGMAGLSTGAAVLVNGCVVAALISGGCVAGATGALVAGAA